ncbi:glycosyltransferase involved in cell wall biosynthesis [Sphingomonas vulcanisoli]|uniref:Glycosyltransferase involved in cell wall biosynthesis n=1 Tax=Sphingomonas vulcanisoli TaxID=1658060 RepID=A0ABX0TRB9_9SPHN|nr:glycosyltransferase family 4 protein [Sphingomonas vulcanisoli]NIJ08071.1 glycosyltransferase involved in cell wall biosynthesis [Sphingomonas vulcanisoli]
MVSKSQAQPERSVLFLDQAGEMGGAQLSLLDLAAAYPREAASVFLFSDGPFRKRLTERGVDVAVAAGAGNFLTVPRGASAFGVLRGVTALGKLVRQVAKRARGYRVIHANSQKALLVGALAARLSGRPLVWHLRDILTAEDTSRTVHWIARTFANKFCTLVIANSDATAQAFREIGGKAPVRLIHNGIDPERFGPDIAAQPRPADIPANAPLIGVFSRLSAWKGQHVAIDALARVEGAHLLLVGGALFGQQPYEARLRAQAESLGLKGRVHFLGDQSDVAGWMRACDVILHSSVQAEPFGRVVVEGMLSERPVVATDAGGVPEIIDRDETGLLVPPRDADAMAAAITALLSDPARADRTAKAGRAAAEQRFSVQTYIANVQAALAEVAEGRLSDAA